MANYNWQANEDPHQARHQTLLVQEAHLGPHALQTTGEG